MPGKTFATWPEMVDNLIPYIGGEEEKSEQEPLKVWGRIENGVIVNAESRPSLRNVSAFPCRTATLLRSSWILRKSPRWMR